MELNLKGKRALVSGASGGLGAEIAAVLAGEGADVIVHGRDAERTKATAHKVGGPVGIGALVLRPGVEITPLTHGGGQERDVRSGTLDVPGTRPSPAFTPVDAERSRLDPSSVHFYLTPVKWRC